MFSNLSSEVRDNRDIFYTNIHREERQGLVSKMRCHHIHLENLRRSEQETGNRNSQSKTKPAGADENFMNSPDYDKVLQTRSKFIESFQKKDQEGMFDAIKFFRRRIDNSQAKYSIVKEFLNTGMVPYFVEILGYSDECLSKVIEQIISIISNCCGGKDAPIGGLKEHGIFEIFVKLLEVTQNIDHLDSIVKGQANIAGSSYQNANHLLNLDICVKIQEKMHQVVFGKMKSKFELETTIPVLHGFLWLVSNLSSCNMKDTYEKCKIFMPICRRVLEMSKNDDCINESLWVVYYLSKNNPYEIGELLKDQGCYQRIVKLLYHPDRIVFSNALRTIANISSFEPEEFENTEISTIITEGICTKALLEGIEHIVKNGRMLNISFNILANLLIGVPENIAKIVARKDLLLDVTSCLMGGKNSEKIHHKTKVEASWVLTNICMFGTVEQLQTLVEDEFLRCLAEMIKIHQDDLDLLVVLFRGASKLMDNGAWIAHERNFERNPFVNEIRDDFEFVRVCEMMTGKLWTESGSGRKAGKIEQVSKDAAKIMGYLKEAANSMDEDSF